MGKSITTVTAKSDLEHFMAIAKEEKFSYKLAGTMLEVFDYIEKSIPATESKNVPKEEQVVFVINISTKSPLFHINYLFFYNPQLKRMEKCSGLNEAITLQIALPFHASIEKAARYMERNYNKPLTLQRIADYVGMNPSYFSTLFKKTMGISYTKYLTEVRMEKAKKLLEKGEKVSVVFESVGYQTYRYFLKKFKENVGVCPGVYKDHKKTEGQNDNFQSFFVGSVKI